MAEAIHCPSCSIRYRLRPERLRPAIRRARCFSCGSTFPVGDVVQRLLALPPQASTAGFHSQDLDAMQAATLPPMEADAPALTLDDLQGSVTEVLDNTLAEVPTFLPEAKELDAAPAQEATAPAVPVPEATAPAVPATDSGLPATTASGYTSARDAIDKLFGNVPAEPAGLKISRHSGDMDMEATLSALDSTLAPAPAQPPAPPAPSPAPVATAPLSEEAFTAEDLTEASSSTVRISQADLLAALASVPASAMESPTEAIRASDLTVPPEERTEMIPAQRHFAPLDEGPDTGAELLRLKIGDDIYGGLTMPQLIDWVDEGRILESHLVARQHSENWLEAYKVPGLRPVFERLRRERSNGAPSLDPLATEPPAKKGLFGGLFGRR